MAFQGAHFLHTRLHCVQRLLAFICRNLILRHALRNRTRISSGSRKERVEWPGSRVLCLQRILNHIGNNVHFLRTNDSADDLAVLVQNGSGVTVDGILDANIGGSKAVDCGEFKPIILLQRRRWRRRRLIAVYRDS